MAARRRTQLRCCAKTECQGAKIKSIKADRMGQDRFERLDFAERWFRDGASVARTPVGILSSAVDMSEARARCAAQKRSGGSVSYIHVLVRAIATVLPVTRTFPSGSRRKHPPAAWCVDVCVSVSTESAVTGVLVVKDAGRKSLEDISAEMQEITLDRGHGGKIKNFARCFADGAGSSLSHC